MCESSVKIGAQTPIENGTTAKKNDGLNPKTPHQNDLSEDSLPESRDQEILSEDYSYELALMDGDQAPCDEIDDGEKPSRDSEKRHRNKRKNTSIFSLVSMSLF